MCRWPPAGCRSEPFGLSPQRDRVALPLIRDCVASGQPFLAICRGFQEVNVAMGGTLYPEIRDLPGRDERVNRTGVSDHEGYYWYQSRHDTGL